MTEVSHTIDINVATPKRILEMITELRYLQLWLADVTAIERVSSLEAGVGTTFVVTRSSVAAPETWTVTEWQPHHHLCLSNQDHHTLWIFDLEPIEHGTCLTLAYQWRQGSLAARLLPLARQHRLVRNSLVRLKELIDFNRDIALLYGIGDE